MPRAKPDAEHVGDEAGINSDAAGTNQHPIDDVLRSNAALQQFAYVAAHELKHPLRSCMTFLHLLDAKSELDPNGKKALHAALDLTGQMDKMIDDLLELARFRSTNLAEEAVSVLAALDEALSNLANEVRCSGATITHDALPRVNVPARHLVQLLGNLIDNAIKFRGSHPPQIHIAVRASDDAFIFCVRDNGLGIDVEHRKHIFDLFQRFTCDSEIPGCGIGLSVCQTIVQKHGGRIWVESPLDQGSAFFFTLPIDKSEST